MRRSLVITMMQHEDNLPTRMCPRRKLLRFPLLGAWMTISLVKLVALLPQAVNGWSSKDSRSPSRPLGPSQLFMQQEDDATIFSRRDFIRRTTFVFGTATGVASGGWAQSGTTCWADGEPMSDDSNQSAQVSSSPSKKPFAPLEKLIPAARVKWTIGAALAIAESMKDDDDEKWHQLETLLLLPQNYTRGLFSEIPANPAKAYLDTYQRNRENLQLLAQPGALLVQSGEIAAWKRLKRQEQQQERQDEIRAALNLYTSALNYNAEAYLLNVPAAERKQMIRQDRLPDIKQVIQSDMGLRYLYRNELLTYMQQVRTELEYQLGLTAELQRSKEELVSLLLQARNACDQWFALIDQQGDIDQAMLAVSKEKEN